MELFLIENQGFNSYDYRKCKVAGREEAKSVIMYEIAFNSKYVCFTYTETDAKTMVKNLSGD